MSHTFTDPFHESGEGKITSIDLVEEHNLMEIGECIAESLYAETINAPSLNTLAARKILDFGPQLELDALPRCYRQEIQSLQIRLNLWTLFGSRTSYCDLGISS